MGHPSLSLGQIRGESWGGDRPGSGAGGESGRWAQSGTGTGPARHGPAWPPTRAGHQNTESIKRARGRVGNGRWLKREMVGLALKGRLREPVG